MIGGYNQKGIMRSLKGKPQRRVARKQKEKTVTRAVPAVMKPEVAARRT